MSQKITAEIYCGSFDQLDLQSLKSLHVFGDYNFKISIAKSKKTNLQSFSNCILGWSIGCDSFLHSFFANKICGEVL